MNSKANTRVSKTIGSRRRGSRHACAGFSFVELIIIMGIILVVSAIAIPALNDAIKAAKNARAVADVRTIGDAALGYCAEYGYAPSNLSEIWYDHQVDGWGHTYRYLAITDSTDPSLMRKDRFGSPINQFFDLYSLGLDGQTSSQLNDPQGQDDIVWADDGVYMGLASKY